MRLTIYLYNDLSNRLKGGKVSNSVMVILFPWPEILKLSKEGKWHCTKNEIFYSEFLQ